MKKWGDIILLVIAGACVLAAVGAIFFGCFALSFVTNRIKLNYKQAEKQMAAYTQSDWLDLYNECIPLFKDTKDFDLVSKDLWPARVKRLNPPCVEVQGDVISMAWNDHTKSPTICLYVLRHEAKANSLDDDKPEPAGIKVTGVNDVPQRPYIKKE